MDPEDIAELTQEEVTELLLGAWATNIKFGDMLETAWGIIANVDWNAATNSPGWREAATRWRDGYHKNLVLIEDHTTDEAEEESLLERMAEEAHDVWCGWLKYMFTRGSSMSSSGPWVMDEVAKRRWVRQMRASYTELSEKEKNSDREIAKRYLNIALTGEPEDAIRTLSSAEVWRLVEKEKKNV